MTFYDKSFYKSISKCQIANLDGASLFNVFYISPEKQMQIRKSPVMVKRIVSYSLDIHPRQMDDTFAAAALDNIFRAHRRYTYGVGFVDRPIGVENVRNSWNISCGGYSQLFIDNTPLHLFMQRYTKNKLLCFDLKEEKYIEVVLEGAKKSFVPHCVHSVFNKSHSLVQSQTSSSVLLVSWRFSSNPNKILVGIVVLVLRCGPIRTDVVIRNNKANEPDTCNVKFSYKQEPGLYAVGKLCMFEGEGCSRPTRDETSGSVLKTSTGEETDCSTDDDLSPRAVIKRFENTARVASGDGKVTNYLFQYYKIGPFVEFDDGHCSKLYRIVNFGGFDILTDSFFVATSCGYLLKLEWNTLRLVYAVKMNFQKISSEMKNVGQEASIILDMCVDSVAQNITQKCQEVVEISTHLFVMVSTAFGPSFVLKIDKATGEVIHSSVGSIQWHSKVVSIEMVPSTESFYVMLKDMRKRPMPFSPKFFVNMGTEELPVTYEGMIVHGSKSNLTSPFGTVAKLVKDTQTVQCYDGNRIFLCKYYLGHNYCTSLF